MKVSKTFVGKWGSASTSRVIIHQKLPSGPKDEENTIQKSGVIYRYKCDRLECNEEYIRKSAMTFGGRFMEHLMASSPIYDHANATGHHTRWTNCLSLVGSHTTLQGP